MLVFPLVRLTNLSLRGGTLLAKFLLIFFLAYFLEPEEVALYGLVVASTAYSLYAIGFDFYAYSTREILASKTSLWMRLIRDQGIFFALAYVCVLPLLGLIFYFGLLPWSVAPWFFSLVILEHLAQELNRMLVAMSRQLLASIVLFLRSGLWALAVIAIFWILPDVRSLETVFAAWTSGALAACISGGGVLLALDRKSLSLPIDWKWIKCGILVAFPLLVATMAVRGLFTVDRYWVQSVTSNEILAAYVLYAGVANAVISFLDAGVFVFIYPKMISDYKSDNFAGFSKGMKKLLIQTVLVYVIFSICAAVIVHPLLVWLAKDAYLQNISLLYYLLVAIGFYALSMVPHYGLYAMSEDKQIIYSHVLAFVLFILLAAVLTQFSPLYGVPLALSGALSAMLAYKTIAYLVASSKQSWGKATKPTH